MTNHKQQWKFLQWNQLDALISQIYFLNKTLHVSDSSSVHHQEFFTAHTAVVYVIQVFLCVQCQTPDDGQRNCPKHVEFYSKNKFEILVHLVGFIIRIYHDARSPERQKQWQCHCDSQYCNRLHWTKGDQVHTFCYWCDLCCSTKGDRHFMSSRYA